MRDTNEGFWGILEGGERLRTLLLLASGGFLLYMLGSLLVPLLLAAILAAITWPLREWTVKRLGGRVVLASASLVVALTLGILVPLALILFLAVLQVRDLSETIKPQEILTWAVNGLDHLGNLSWIRRAGIAPGEILAKLREALPQGAGMLFSSVATISLGLVQSLGGIALMILSLFYMLLSGDRLIERIRLLMPLPEGETSALLEVFRTTSMAILKGNFVIAVIQGALTGGLFAVVGLPSPIFFGVVAALCSLIPSIGSALVWFPAGLLLGLTGSWMSMFFVFGFGGFVISLIDNILRPILVGRDTGMHDLTVLLTTLGGLSFFGPLGILFGPLVGAAFLALLARHEQRALVAEHGSVVPDAATETTETPA